MNIKAIILFVLSFLILTATFATSAYLLYDYEQTGRSSLLEEEDG